MSYKNIREILPGELVEMIQDYIEGQYIYIPKKEENRLSWGHNTGFKKELEHRNSEIFNEYSNGMHPNELSQRYFLSVKSIQRIISNEKKKLY